MATAGATAASATQVRSTALVAIKASDLDYNDGREGVSIPSGGNGRSAMDLEGGERLEIVHFAGAG